MKKKIGLWIYQNEGGDKITERIKLKLEDLGHEVISGFDLRQAYIHNCEVFTLEGINLSELDILYHMNADQQSTHQIEMLQYIEKSGVKVVNSYDAYVNSRNKLMTNFMLRSNNISVPEILLIAEKTKPDAIYAFFEKHKSVVVKPRSNHGGKGILKFSDPNDFLDYTEMVEGFFDNHYIEAFIDFGDMDYRVEVVDNCVVGGYRRMKRHAFKTNIGSGGKMVAELPEKSVTDLGLMASRIMKMNCTIVDIVKSKINGELYVLEVNPIMGIFLESALKSGYKLPSEISVDELFRTDDLKIDLLIKMIAQ